MGEGREGRRGRALHPFWQSYIPYHIAADILAHPEANPVGREQRGEAVALFADISGFTALSEALGHAGRSGTEELTNILNGYFGPMIALIQSYGGIIVNFGGDGLMVLFPYIAHNRQAAVRRAVQCALDMQAAMPHYAELQTSAGVFGMGMQAGLAMGPVFSTSVGDPDIRLLSITAGNVLSRAAEAEQHAERGEVVLHRDLLAYTGPAWAGPTRGAFHVVTRLGRPARPRILAPLPIVDSETVQATLAAYLPPAIARRLRERQGGFINEHRPVTSIFVNFSGFDYDHDPNVGVKLGAYFAAVTRIVAQYDGYLNKIDIGDKGNTYLVLFGAPVAHENDAERALRCALNLRSVPGRVTRMGINSGVVYCGNVGAAARQEYTVMGGAVNLAVRLMQNAGPNEILVSPAVQHLAPPVFQWEEQRLITVKGRTDPVPVLALAGMESRAVFPTTEPIDALPIVGREAERQQIAELLDEVARGQGRIIGVTGESGLGKSRFTAEIMRLARRRGLAVYMGECQSHGMNMPYLVWQNLLRGLFDLDGEAPPMEQVQQLQAQLAAVDPQFVARMPLLRVAVNLPIRETDLTRSLDAGLRKDSLEALLVSYIAHRARLAREGQGVPFLLVLEDCHWIDPLSRALLLAVARNLEDLPVLLVIVYRPSEIYGGGPGLVSTLPGFAEIRLAELSPAESESLIRLRAAQLFGPRDIPPTLIARIIERTEGNPLYIEELITLIHSQGHDLADVAALHVFDLPANLYSLILSRIDELAEAEKATLKVASVIGRLFPAAWLWGSYPQLGAPAQVLIYLETLSNLDLVALARPDPERSYLFKHILTQEVAYESLAVATRARLHEQIAAFLERTYAGELATGGGQAPAPPLNLLAHHYGQSENRDKQREYFLRAGEAAQATYANEAAIGYYERLLPLLDPAARVPILLKMGAIWQLTGQWPVAEALYRDALADPQVSGDRAGRAALQCALGDQLGLQGAYREAIEWLEQARAGWEHMGDRQGIGKAIGSIGTIQWRQGNYPAALAAGEQQLAIAAELGDQHGIGQAARNMALVYWDQGDYPRALAYSAQQLQVATTLGDRQGILQAVGNMGGVYWRQGDTERALACFEQTMQIARQIGDRRAVSNTLGHIGAVYWSQGAYARAFSCFAEQLAIADEIGERRGVMMAVGNLGVLYSEQGSYPPALACLAQQLRMADELGDLQYMSIAAENMAIAGTVQGQYAEAEQLCERAIALGNALHIPYHLCEYLHLRADLHLRQGRPAQAQPLNDKALGLAIRVERKDIEFAARVLAARLWVLLDQTDSATALAELRTLAVRWTDEGARAALDYAGWQIDPRPASAQQAAAAYRSLYARTPKREYQDRYAELTGERLPDPPPLPAPPADIPAGPVDLPVLLARIDAVVVGIPALPDED